MPPKGLSEMLNNILDTKIENNTLYARSVPRIDNTTDFGTWASPILNNTEVMNEFVPALMQMIVYTWVQIRYFDNPLKSLEGTDIPLGAKARDIIANPAVGRRFNPNDFAGLLAKYEADIKIQYNEVNADWQYVVTTSEDNIRGAMTSWDSLSQFIEANVSALYNGFYIDDYNTTKGLIGSAYAQNMVVTKLATMPTNETQAKSLIRQARANYLNMQLPSTEYNAWSQIGGAGRALKTWANAEDIVIFMTNDLLAQVDVEVLANAFNMDKTTFLGRVYGVDNFNRYDDDGNLIFDGSKIIFAIGDKRWFRIKPQLMRFDQFFNANNTTWQNYLRVKKMYQFSYFANMVVYASELPTVAIQSINFGTNTTLDMNAGTSRTINLGVTPQAYTNTITWTVKKGTTNSSDLVVSQNGNTLSVDAKASASGQYKVTGTAGDVVAVMTVNVTPTADTPSTNEPTEPTNDNK